MNNGEVTFKKNEMIIDTGNCNTPIAPYELVKTMRASFYVLGPFMSRYNHAEVSLPGGCAIGTRPINIHLYGLEKLGIQFLIQKGYVIGQVKKELIGKALDFNKDINFLNKENCYHHVGIYSFRYSILKKFISLPSTTGVKKPTTGGRLFKINSN